MEKKNSIVIVLVLALAVFVVASIWMKYGRRAPETTEGQNESATVEGISTSTLTGETATTTPTSTDAKKPVVKKPAASSSAADISYTKALNIYQKSGFYFQFVKCGGNPGSLTLKKGMQFMLDNRDPKAHTLAFGKQSYYVKGYGFVVATARYVGNFFITCDGGGAAKILIQP